MDELIAKLHEGGYSCVINKDGETVTFSRGGIADLYDLTQNKPGFLKDAVVADKIVGKGAAALMILGGISALYADVISQPALNLLRKAGIKPDFAQEVPFIWNRENTDWCPIEKLCYKETSAEAILPLIDRFFTQHRKA